MRKRYLDAVCKFEPFTALYQLGANPESVKEAVVGLLNPYVPDKAKLADSAVSHLAGEAISVGRLCSKPDWKGLLDRCFSIRNAAIAADPKRAFEVMGYFDSMILEAQKSYALLVVFEVPKNDLALDEFAFELLRTIGTLVESNLQPYLKELCCLEAVAVGRMVDPIEVVSTDFGQICERLGQSEKNVPLLTPQPWQIRVNQWRNIAQHHAFVCDCDSIIVKYGRTRPPKEAALTRPELLMVAQELVGRLGAMKTSRAITHFNHIEQLQSYLPPAKPHPYNDVTSLAAAFATQGFRLTDLEATDTEVDAVIEDAAPRNDLVRPIHCSQFVATIAERFPGRSVRIRYFVEGRHSWTFGASAADLTRVMCLEDPLRELAHVIEFKREP